MTLRDAAARLVKAIARATEEHGSPNRFWFRELEQYGGPPAMIAGRAARLYRDRLSTEADAWLVNGAIEVGAVICGVCEHEWCGPADMPSGEPAPCPRCGNKYEDHVVRGS